MEDTCNFEECYFGELFSKPEECPNFIQSTWRSEESGEVKVMKDCAPKRTFLMIQELYSRLIGLQKDSEEERNAHEKVAQSLLSVVRTAQEGGVVPMRRLDDTNTS